MWIYIIKVSDVGQDYYGMYKAYLTEEEAALEVEELKVLATEQLRKYNEWFDSDMREEEMPEFNDIDTVYSIAKIWLETNKI